MKFALVLIFRETKKYVESGVVVSSLVIFWSIKKKRFWKLASSSRNLAISVTALSMSTMLGTRFIGVTTNPKRGHTVQPALVEADRLVSHDHLGGLLFSVDHQRHRSRVAVVHRPVDSLRRLCVFWGNFLLAVFSIYVTMWARDAEVKKSETQWGFLVIFLLYLKLTYNNIKTNLSNTDLFNKHIWIVFEKHEGGSQTTFPPLAQVCCKWLSYRWTTRSTASRTSWNWSSSRMWLLTAACRGKGNEKGMFLEIQCFTQSFSLTVTSALWRW